MENNNKSLMRKIQELSFAQVECELYLDAHPDNTQALAYYRDILAMLDELMTKYQNEVGPIFQEGIVGDEWLWVKKPWPWQLPEESEDK